jgi:hypothetical protein
MKETKKYNLPEDLDALSKAYDGLAGGGQIVFKKEKNNTTINVNGQISKILKPIETNEGNLTVH